MVLLSVIEIYWFGRLESAFPNPGLPTVTCLLIKTGSLTIVREI